jgi:hypothetical protein
MTSDMQGAPTLTAAAGSLISVLDACLINGFNLLTLDSLTYDASANEATATISSGHGFLKHQIVTIAGASDTAYNGEQRVTYIDSTTFRYTPIAAPAATSATGTLTAKAAPVGNWEKAFDDGNGTKAAYRSSDPEATGLYLRLDDTNSISGWNSNGANTRAFGCETMTDIDTWTGQFEDTFDGRGSWIRKHQSSSGTDARPWALIADSRLLYLFTYPNSGYYPNGGSAYAFGDVISYRPGDAYGTILIPGDCNGRSYDAINDFAYFTSNSGCVLARAYHQNPGSIPFGKKAGQLSDYLGYGGLSFPNAADNGLYLHAPVLVTESNDRILRGELPGLKQCLHTVPVATHTILEDVGGVAGARVLALSCGSNYNNDYEAQPMFDLTGPWR